jgi:hypothetical protein
MPHEYTRQRQGRDFIMPEKLLDAPEADHIDNENTQKSAEAKKSLTQRLEHFKEEAERNALPIDGTEPPEKRGLQK